MPCGVSTTKCPRPKAFTTKLDPPPGKSSTCKLSPVCRTRPEMLRVAPGPNDWQFKRAARSIILLSLRPSSPTSRWINVKSQLGLSLADAAGSQKFPAPASTRNGPLADPRYRVLVLGNDYILRFEFSMSTAVTRDMRTFSGCRRSTG